MRPRSQSRQTKLLYDIGKLFVSQDFEFFRGILELVKKATQQRPTPEAFGHHLQIEPEPT